MYASIWAELAAEKAMVFMAGPRQAGKTTLARDIAGGHANRISFNWDVVTDRKKLIARPYAFEDVERHDDSKPIVVFDEIHKRRDWRGYLKGAYDRFRDDFRFLVTGSGTLETGRRSGESLAGRYEIFHLWPFTLAELAGRRQSLRDFLADPLGIAADADGSAVRIWRRLADFSGFPEPYSLARPASYNRWSRTYHSQVMREEILELTGITAVTSLETLASLLPERVGSLLSIQSLAEDLDVAYNTAKSWIEAMERYYTAFTLKPWARHVNRTIRKARKLYLFDYAAIENRAARLENMIALELFRAVNMWNDLGYGTFGLHFVRNKQKEEVDFLLSDKSKPLLLVEVKAGKAQMDAGLARFQEQLDVPAIILTGEGDSFRRMTSGPLPALIAPAHLWVPRLP